jgi:hypothetical protein
MAACALFLEYRAIGQKRIEGERILGADEPHHHSLDTEAFDMTATPFHIGTEIVSNDPASPGSCLAGPLRGALASQAGERKPGSTPGVNELPIDADEGEYGSRKRGRV